jgi:hypothetical protein
MRPPIIALIYPLQRKLTKHSTAETKNNLLYCEHLREQYNKCILYDTLNCKEIYEPIMIGFKCSLTP